MKASRGVRPKSWLRIDLSVECSGEAVAEALNDALMPDNRYFPRDQRFRASKVGRSLNFTIESPRVRPAVSTATSLVSDAKLFGDVWVEAKTRGLGSVSPR